MVRVVKVENAEQWFAWSEYRRECFSTHVDAYYWTFTLGHRVKCQQPEQQEKLLLNFIRQLHEMKIGEVTTLWPNHAPIEFCHAKIKLGDVFDFYTSSDGVLKVPKWKSFKYAVEEYLESRVQ